MTRNESLSAGTAHVAIFHARRIELRLSMVALSRAAGLSGAYVHQIETGRLKNPSAEARAALALVLDLDPDVLFADFPTPHGRAVADRRRHELKLYMEGKTQLEIAALLDIPRPWRSIWRWRRTTRRVPRPSPLSPAPGGSQRPKPPRPTSSIRRVFAGRSTRGSCAGNDTTSGAKSVAASTRTNSPRTSRTCLNAATRDVTGWHSRRLAPVAVRTLVRSRRKGQSVPVRRAGGSLTRSEGSRVPMFGSAS
jgi:transcriptional regulator with XRE-family HTH domain